ncbi:MAG: BrnT family toxin [Treponema sp.]|nr:BrnT family toxin [Treponema sp.]
MGRTIISEDGRYEWDENKDRLNRKNHGFSFAEILEVFDDPAFLEGFDREHSGKEERYYGIGCLNSFLYIIVFYTLRQRQRIRIISARRTDSDEQEEYDGYFKKVKS